MKPGFMTLLCFKFGLREIIVICTQYTYIQTIEYIYIYTQYTYIQTIEYKRESKPDNLSSSSNIIEKLIV